MNGEAGETNKHGEKIQNVGGVAVVVLVDKALFSQTKI